MKHYEKYTEEVARKRLLKTTCDRCGGTVERPGQFQRRRFGLKAYTETSYPGYADVWQDGWLVDAFCNGCVEWLHDMLEKEGVKITHFQYDDADP